MDIVLLVLWGICGIVNLINGNIGRLSYGLIWAVLMINLLEKVVG